MQANRLRRSGACVLTLPCRRVTGAARGKVICITRNPLQVSIDAFGGFRRCARKNVTHHESDSMVLSVLLLDESIHSLDHVLAT